MFNFYTELLSNSNNLTSLEVGYGELKLWYNSCAFKPPNSSLTNNNNETIFPL